MYKYFDSKKDLYNYIVDYCVEKVLANVESLHNNDFKSLKDLIYVYAEKEFDFYINNTKIYFLFKKVFIESKNDIDKKIIEKYTEKSEKYVLKIFNKFIKPNEYEKKNLIFWVIRGVTELVFSQNDLGLEDPKKTKEKFMVLLKSHINLLDL